MSWLLLFLSEILAFGQCEIRLRRVKYASHVKYSPLCGECDSYLTAAFLAINPVDGTAGAMTGGTGMNLSVSADCHFAGRMGAGRA